ncbi:MAG: alpha/beta hydrolase [Proteobacteria bacterium]|nr:alpha/beta hydrolase [Pseudomonadota bacterium]
MSWQSLVTSFFVRRAMKKKRPMDHSLEEARTALSRLNNSYLRKPANISLSPVVTDRIKGEWVTHTPTKDNAAIYYLHGGGYFWGSPKTHREITYRLASAAEGRVFALDYRLAPEHPFPAALEDAVAGYEWLRAELGEAAQITIAGDSAGGGLALATLLALKDRGLVQPAAAMLISPWTDLSCSGQSMIDNAAKDPVFWPASLRHVAGYYAETEDLENPLVSPLFGDMSGLPPILLQVGSTEILLDDSRRLAERLQEAGISCRLDIWPDMVHVWHMAASFVPEGRQAILEIAQFAREHTTLEPAS